MKARTLEDTNKLLKIPTELYSEDGRKFLITNWKAHSKFDDVPRIKIKAIPIFLEQPMMYSQSKYDK